MRVHEKIWQRNERSRIDLISYVYELRALVKNTFSSCIYRWYNWKFVKRWIWDGDYAIFLKCVIIASLPDNWKNVVTVLKNREVRTVVGWYGSPGIGRIGSGGGRRLNLGMRRSTTHMRESECGHEQTGSNGICNPLLGKKYAEQKTGHELKTTHELLNWHDEKRMVCNSEKHPGEDTRKKVI